jgi:hypothetical protein
MTRTIATLTLCAALAGCASLPQAASSKETFALCQAADVATTAVLLSRGGFMEGNPIMASLIRQGWLPFIGFKAALVWVVYTFEFTPNAQVAFNAIACAPVINNVGHL